MFLCVSYLSFKGHNLFWLTQDESRCLKTGGSGQVYNNYNYDDDIHLIYLDIL